MPKTCPKCRADNADTARFCSNCATSLGLAGDVQVSHTRTLETPLEELTTGSIFAGRYQIIEELGHGGMGRVYRTLDKKINEEVALKLIRPEIASEKRTLERFGNELKIARKIAHKNVGKMYHLSEEKGTHYITMEYVPGEDLKRMIRMSKQLSVPTAVDIGKQICEGLAEAHRLGIVHRDLKPANIMIDREGNARIMDFGIARLLSAKGITGAGVAVGTPEYMSPEQVEGKEADARADIYSLGIILYEMVTGRVPFEADTPYAVGYKHKNEVPISPKAVNPQVPDDLSALILKCLEKEPDKRFQTADVLHSELEKIEKGLPTTTKLTPAPKRTSLTSREITIKFTARKLIVPGLAFIAIVAAVVLAVIFLPHRAPQPKASAIHKQITFTGTASNPAISSDGKFLAYADNIAVNDRRIMVQDMVGGQTIEVARGRNCYGLCWSPDGAELAYYGQKSDETWATWIVPRLGGTARELDEVSVVAWSPDGTRLGHWSDEKKQLLIVNRTTGESQPVSTDKKLPPYAEDLDWSPSGKLIVLSMYDENDKYSIWIVSVDGLRQQMILEDPQFWGGTPRWSPRGDAIYYLLEREQTTSLWKVPVSPDSGKPMKPPLPVLEGHQIGSYFTITNDGKKLAYTRETGNNNLWLASIEGSGKSQRADVKPLTRGTLNSSSPNFSPDGKSIVCVRGADKTDVYVMPAEGGTARRLTFLDAWVGGPVWSPEGNEIAFFGAQGEEPVRIWKVDTAGGQPRKFDRAEGMWPGWAPGPKVLYQTYTRLNLMALDPATGEVASLLKEDADWLMVWPTWSPDGKRIALRWKKGPESQAGLWLFSPGDSSLVLLRKGPAMPSGWSADGKWIYAWEPVSGGGDILAISPENGQAEVLCHVPLGPEIGRVWLPPNTVDGRHFVVTGHTSPSDVWIMEHFDPDIK